MAIKIKNITSNNYTCELCNAKQNLYKIEIMSCDVICGKCMKEIFKDCDLSLLYNGSITE